VRAATLTSRMPELQRLAREARPSPSFRAALRRDDVAVIAEVKRSSPSRGKINPTLDLHRQVRSYEKGGAAAISILTEPGKFGGSSADLVKARETVGVPILKKDFHVEPVQILEAKALGASAALLIARAVSPGKLGELVRAAADIGLEVVVEVRDERELELALSLGAAMVGVNNRNLESLEIDPSTSLRILPLLPRGVVAIAESGFKTASDVERVAEAGADAVLVGSELSGSSDPEAAVRALTGIRRRDGARQG
jgi:indole-3-glycerol phosphate synthase